MLVIPLIVSALALGVAGLGDLRPARADRRCKTLAYTVVVSAHRGAARRRPREPRPARATGLDPALARARSRRGRRARRRRRRRRAPAASTSSSSSCPTNVVQAMADGDMLAVMVFALFLGIGLALTRTEAGAPLRGGAPGPLRRRDAAARPRDPAGAGRRRLPALHAHRAARLRRAARSSARYVAVVLARARDPAVRASTRSRSRWLGGMSPLPLLPRHPRRDADRVLDRVEQRDAADRAARRRARSSSCRRT